MLLLLRVLIFLAVLGALGYGALYALAVMVEPEAREIVTPVPMPRPRGG